MFNEKFLERHCIKIDPTIWIVHSKNQLGFELGDTIKAIKSNNAYFLCLLGESQVEESFWMRFLNSDYNGD